MALNFLKSIWPGTDKPLGGRYQVVAQLGAGGFGQTFQAQDLHLPGQPLCVIKQLKPQVSGAKELEVAQRLFDTEARVLYELGNHPQIPRLLAHFEDGQQFYLAQELIEGHSLSEELDRGQSWDETRVVALLGDILGTLAFVHARGVIHRDLKPSNLIRRHHDQRIVLIDFGAVKEAGTQLSTSSAQMTRTVSIGTQGYMPNEQLGGTPRFSSDVYAVGMIGIQALTGRHPRFLTADPRTGEIDWQGHAPQATPELVAVLNRMIKYDYRARYETAADALAALQALPDLLRQAVPVPVGLQDWLATGNVSRTGESGAGLRGGQSVSLPPTIPSSASAPAEGQAQTIPNTQPESTTSLPITQSDPSSSAQVPPPSRPFPPNSDPSATAELTLPVMGQRPGRSPAPSWGHSAQATEPLLSRRTAPVSGRSVATSIPTSLGGMRLPRMLLPGGAIALILGLGLITWRACAPEPEGLHNSATQPDAATPSDTATANAAALQTLLEQASAAQTANQHDQAIAAFDQAIALDATSTQAHVGRCYSLNRLQQYEPAIAACDRAIALDPQNARALWSKGYALDQQQQYQEALALYDQALALDPNFAEAWSNKGTALLRLGNQEQAVEAFDRALVLDETLAEAWNNRGAALWDLRRFEEALTSVERAIALQPNYQDAKALRQEMRKRLRGN